MSLIKRRDRSPRAAERLKMSAYGARPCDCVGAEARPHPRSVHIITLRRLLHFTGGTLARRAGGRA